MALDNTTEMDIDTISLDSDTDDLSLPDSSESDAEGSSPGKPGLNNFVPVQPFWWTQGTSGDTSQIPELLQHPTLSHLHIQLVQGHLPERGKRWSEVVLPGHEPTIKLYSSLRPFPATHYSCGGLTVRNKHELPQCLFYDPLFGQVAESLGLTNCSLDQPALKAVVSPKFGEWLMGLPQGWTSPYLPVNFAVLGAHIVSQQPVLEHKHHVLSLFSGCGALDYALSPWCHSLAYCEIDIDAQSVLQARMKDGSLTHGKIFGDIRSLTRGTLMKELGEVSVDGLVFGFPCVDTCRAGKMKGIIDGPQSNLVWEAMRLAEELRVAFMFIENVDNTRFLRFGGAQCLVDALTQAGFRCSWVSVGAVHVGCPQRRKRWFLLATRGHMLHQLFATPPDDSLREHIAQNSGLSFNGGRPPPKAWMLPREEYKDVKHCLTQLGNCVIPAQAILAARLLSSAVCCQ
jgi:hypothetical protein